MTKLYAEIQLIFITLFVLLYSGHLVERKWENCLTVGPEIIQNT